MGTGHLDHGDPILCHQLISIPAFVALKEGGGLSWLQYELAVPLAMILIIALLVPVFRGLRLVSVFEYLEFEQC